jgi:hypothetical protein
MPPSAGTILILSASPRGELAEISITSTAVESSRARPALGITSRRT